jgi:outer membrane protein assembly factor BamA
VDQKTLAFEPGAVLNLGWRARDKNEGDQRSQGSTVAKIRPTVGRIEAGPVVRWFDAEPVADSPLATLIGPSDNSFGHVGLRASLDLDRTDADAVPMRGWRFHADVLGAPPVWDLEQAFTRTRADASAYVPLVPNRVHLAMRGGASMASGTFPTQYAATVGGWNTLRGFSYDRFSGDASVDGSTELRVPVGTVNLLLRWDAGVFGLADVGRVWMSGESDGRWHRGFGGGVWLTALGRAVSVAYAKGDEHRVNLKAGLF